jgi:hypothetical protein
MSDENKHGEKIRIAKLNNLLSTTETNLNDSSDPYSDQLSQILPNLYLCGEQPIRDFNKLKQLRITHIVNCASPVLMDEYEIPERIWSGVNIDASYYRGIGIKEENYMAIPALDRPEFDISQFFEKATRFIDSALNPTDVTAQSDKSAAASSKSSNTGQVVVHCAAGRSRSAAIVIAYLLMRKYDPFPTLEDAIRFVKCRRDIYPNDGFLEQLIHLERRLQSSRQNSERERVGQTKDKAITSPVQPVKVTRQSQTPKQNEGKTHTGNARAAESSKQQQQQTRDKSLNSTKLPHVTRTPTEDQAKVPSKTGNKNVTKSVH